MTSTHASAGGQSLPIECGYAFSSQRRATSMRRPPLSTPVSSGIVAIILSSIRGTCDQYWEVRLCLLKRMGSTISTGIKVLIHPLRLRRYGGRQSRHTITL